MQEKTLTGGRSYYLDIARAIAIISISLNHAVNRTYDNYFGQSFWSPPISHRC